MCVELNVFFIKGENTLCKLDRIGQRENNVCFSFFILHGDNTMETTGQVNSRPGAKCLWINTPLFLKEV